MSNLLFLTVALVCTTGAAISGAQTAPEQEASRAVRDSWVAARALAPAGGAIELLGPVTDQLKDIERLRVAAAGTPSIEGARLALVLRYADAAVRAAIAAAQDERDEMKVFLGHARALDGQLAGMGYAAELPLPIDELEAELWLEVDGYTEAHQAYLRAIANGGGARAWLGLARTNDRMGNRLAACDAYRRASRGTLSDDEKGEAIAFLNSSACTVADRQLGAAER